MSGEGQPPQQAQPQQSPQPSQSPQQPAANLQINAGPTAGQTTGGAENGNTGADDGDGIDEMIARVLKRAGETKGQRLWGAYVVCPGKRFMDEMENERIVMILRAHPIQNLGWVIFTFILLMIPGVVTSLGALSIVAAKYLFMGRMIWYLMVLGFAFEKFLDWYYSFLIVTNERLVDVDFINLLTRDIQYANLNHIEEPSLVSGGFVRSIFNYGDVSVATAADEPAIEALAVPWPERVVNIISELSEELEKSQLRRTVI